MKCILAIVIILWLGKVLSCLQLEVMVKQFVITHIPALAFLRV